MLYWYIAFKDAVCNACQRDCGCDECNSVLRAIYRSNSECGSDRTCRSDERSLFPDLHLQNLIPISACRRLSAFWVIVSILLGGGLFGILGMLFGVPAFAVIYYIVKLFLDNQLEKKKLPTESECYNGDSYVDNDGTYFQKKDNMTENEEQKTEENKKEKEE